MILWRHSLLYIAGKKNKVTGTYVGQLDIFTVDELSWPRPIAMQFELGKTTGKNRKAVEC